MGSWHYARRFQPGEGAFSWLQIFGWTFVWISNYGHITARHSAHCSIIISCGFDYTFKINKQEMFKRPLTSSKRAAAAAAAAACSFPCLGSAEPWRWRGRPLPLLAANWACWPPRPRSPPLTTRRRGQRRDTTKNRCPARTAPRRGGPHTMGRAFTTHGTSFI